MGPCRSDVEIRRAMNSQLTGAEPGLLRYYRMDEKASSGGTLRDLTGRSNGTLTGSVLYSLNGPAGPAANAGGGLWFRRRQRRGDLAAGRCRLLDGLYPGSVGQLRQQRALRAHFRALPQLDDQQHHPGPRQRPSPDLGLWVTRDGSTGVLVAKEPSKTTRGCTWP